MRPENAHEIIMIAFFGVVLLCLLRMASSNFSKMAGGQITNKLFI
jgi:hypothetical protein